MAKQRAALGRGLSALMGVEEPLDEEQEKAVEEPDKGDEGASNISGTVEESQDVAAEQPAPKTGAARKSSTRRVSSKTASKTTKPKASNGKAKANSPKVASKTTSKAANAGYEEERDSFDVDIELIIANPDQPRTHFDQDELEELADSIKKNGLLQPILVRKIGALYQIIAGERRWQACKMIGLNKVPIRVTVADDIQSIALAMIENIQRSDLNPMEEAYGYHMLMERNNMTQAELAEAVSKARPTIANTLRLLDLPEDAQQLLFEGTITAGHARAILSIPNEEGRRILTKRLVEQSTTVREAENLARLLAGRKNTAVKRAPMPAQFKKVAKSLREALGTNVRVKTVKGKNKIEIEFKDEEELEQIFRRMIPDE